MADSAGEILEGFGVVDLVTGIGYWVVSPTLDLPE